MIEQLKTLVAKTSLKHLALALRRDTKLHQWVMNVTQHIQTSNMSERIYCAVNRQTNICQRGNVRKFHSFNHGHVFCGKPGVCECARESISRNVRATKLAATPEQKAATNAKRVATNLERHEVTNTGQTPAAIAAHTAFYADPIKCAAVVARVSATCMARYGVDNALKMPKVQLMRTHSKPSHTPAVKAKRRATRQQHFANNPRHFLEVSYQHMVQKLLDLGIQMLSPVDEYMGSDISKKYKFACSSCDYEFTARITGGNRPKCPMCSPNTPNYVSGEERQIRLHLEQLGMEVVGSDRSLINPHELDIVVRSHSLAVEYCGLYWHSQYAGGKSPQYHADKMRKCNLRDFDLITVFSSDLAERRQPLLHVLARAVGQLPQLDPILLEIAEISPAHAVEFVRSHSMSDIVDCDSAWALVRHGSPVAVMCLSETIDSGIWAVDAHAVSHNIPNWEHLIFDAFCAKHNPTEVVAICNSRWLDHKPLQVLGFVEIDKHMPRPMLVSNYVSVEPLDQDALDDEHFDAREMGADVIWDCGARVLVWTRG